MLFKYTGFDKDGKLIKGQLEAESIAGLKAQLKHKKIIYKTINKWTI